MQKYENSSVKCSVKLCRKPAATVSNLQLSDVLNNGDKKDVSHFYD